MDKRKRSLSVVERCSHVWTSIQVPSDGWVDAPTVTRTYCANKCGAVV